MEGKGVHSPSEKEFAALGSLSLSLSLSLRAVHAGAEERSIVRVREQRVGTLDHTRTLIVRVIPVVGGQRRTCSSDCTKQKNTNKQVVVGMSENVLAHRRRSTTINAQRVLLNGTVAQGSISICSRIGRNAGGMPGGMPDGAAGAAGAPVELALGGGAGAGAGAGAGGGDGGAKVVLEQPASRARVAPQYWYTS